MSNIPYDLHRFNRLMEESDDFLKNGVFDRAVMCLKQALAMKPDVFKLGIRGLKQAFEKKLRALSTLAKIVNDTKQSEYQIDFACEVTQFYLEKWDENCEKALLLCLQNTMINPQNLAVPGIRLLNLKGFSINDPLLLSLMENALLPDVHLEKILTEKRKELLFLAQEDGLLESHKPFIYALSIQCGINEYVYNVSEIENALVDNLLEGIHSASPEFDQKTNLLVALLSCYRPLHDTHLSQSLSHSSFLGEDGAFLRIIKKHLLDPERENQLASSIPLLNSFKDDISLKVRQQYEEHPYPHWTRLELMEPVDFHEHMDELFPNVKASKKIERATPPPGFWWQAAGLVIKRSTARFIIAIAKSLVLT